LTTFADLVAQVFDEVLADGGTEDWARAVATLLGIGVGKLAHYGSSQTRMELATGTSNGGTHPAFGRNDIPMTWDFAETNPFGGRSGGWLQYLDTSLKALSHASHGEGTAGLADAREAKAGGPALVATDPPYFDAIGYADLSDYFYVWHRRALRSVHPDLYRTIAAPRVGELTAVPSHHGGKDAAKHYFIEGFTETFQSLAGELGRNLPMLVVYASKEQKSGKDEGTRWSSILTAMLAADLEITGAWPIHGTGGTRMISQGTNAVATYVAMVARPRSADATTCSLGEFNRVLRRELPTAVHALQEASILPVDMAQAVMGPGMSIFSRYVAVIDQEGNALGVPDALRLINSVYAEVQEEQEGYLDADSQFAVAWWHKHGWATGTFGEADALARPKGISVDDVARAGVIAQQPNKVTAVGNAGLDREWDPASDVRATSWEAVHHLVDRLIDGGGQTEAARLLAKVDEVGLADSARMLTYRLAAIAAGTQRTKDEERYNALIEAWPRLVSNAPTEGLF
jgi:putative DNA methylase